MGRREAEPRVGAARRGFRLGDGKGSVIDDDDYD